MLGLILLIGGFRYAVITNCNDMGSVMFPLDDRKSDRFIAVCRDVDVNQRRLAAEHELHHICYHNHEHTFATKAELDEHLNHRFTEEESIEIVTPCIVDNRAIVYKAFGVP
jgi:hypothetical protein